MNSAQTVINSVLSPKNCCAWIKRKTEWGETQTWNAAQCGSKHSFIIIVIKIMFSTLNFTTVCNKLRETIISEYDKLIYPCQCAN